LHIPYQASYATIFNLAGDIAVDSAGNVYVIDTFNNRVEKFGSVPIIPMEQAVLIIVIAVIVGSVGAYLTMRKRPKNLRRLTPN
jgi:uncharacterized membrane protein YfcA